MTVLGFFTASSIVPGYQWLAASSRGCQMNAYSLQPSRRPAWHKTGFNFKRESASASSSICPVRKCNAEPLRKNFDGRSATPAKSAGTLPAATSNPEMYSSATGATFNRPPAFREPLHPCACGRWRPCSVRCCRLLRFPAHSPLCGHRRARRSVPPGQWSRR